MDFKPTNLPIENDYPKLVRDRIIEFIKRDGKQANWETLKSDEEFLKYLLKKLMEESTEMANASSSDNMKEEMADICEILDAILKLKNWDKAEILKIQNEKRQKNGGFDKRILLISK